MGVLTYLVIGLLAAAGYASAACSVVQGASCHPGFDAVFTDGPNGPNYACILLNQQALYTYDAAKAYCQSYEGGFLAEPIGYLHHSIYNLIKCHGYDHEAFWIGGTDAGHEDYWEWETSGLEMPRSTPDWHPCEPRQPLVSDFNANHACMWEPDFYFFSCTEGISIRAMCQTGPVLNSG
jgi:hypothetical protein